VRAGGAGGSAVGGIRPGRRAEEAQFEMPASRWVEVDGAPGGGRALGLVSESVYGFGAQSGETVGGGPAVVLHASLVRSSVVTATGLDGPRREDAGPTHFERSVAGHPLGEWGPARNGCRFLILGPGDDPQHAGTAAVAESVFTEPVRVRREAGAGGETAAPGACGVLDVETSRSVVACWAKPAAGAGWVLRLHETAGETGRVGLRLAEGWSARAVDAREQPGGRAKPVSPGVFELAPNAFGSVLIERGS